MASSSAVRITPWPRKPSHWRYRGTPVLLLGGTREDNLFRKPYLAEELDRLASACRG